MKPITKEWLDDVKDGAAHHTRSKELLVTIDCMVVVIRAALEWREKQKTGPSCCAMMLEDIVSGLGPMKGESK